MEITVCAVNCDYPILLAFYNVGKVTYNWTGVRAANCNI